MRPSRAARTVFGVALCALVALAACHARRGDAPRPPPVGLRSAWQVTLPFEVHAASAAARWLVLEARDQYAVLDAETGRVAFTHRKEAWTGFTPVALPTVGGALIELTAASLHALDLRTGSARWRVAFADLGLAPTEYLTANGRVVVTCGKGVVTALDERSGARRWSADTRHCVPLQSDASRVYVDTPRGLVAFDALTGARRWTAAPPPGPDAVYDGASVAVTDGRVVLRRASGGQATIFDAATGRLVRDLELPDLSVTGFSAHGDALLVHGARSSAERDVVVVSLTTGRTLWRARELAGGRYFLAEDALYVHATSQDQLVTLDPRSGRELGRQGVAAAPGFGVVAGFDAWTLVRVARADHDRSPSPVAFVDTHPDGRGGTVVDGLAQATVLPMEDARVEGRVDGALCSGTGFVERFRVRVGDAVVVADPHGRFTAAVRARASVPVRPEPSPYGGEVVPACRLEPRPMTLWLDGRRKAYPLSLRTEAPLSITDELE